jgi:hypothetical protein
MHVEAGADERGELHSAQQRAGVVEPGDLEPAESALTASVVMRLALGISAGRQVGGVAVGRLGGEGDAVGQRHRDQSVALAQPAPGAGEPGVHVSGSPSGRTTSHSTGSPVPVSTANASQCRPRWVALVRVARVGAVRGQVHIAVQRVGQVVGERQVPLAVVDQQPDVGLAFAAGPDRGRERVAEQAAAVGLERARVHVVGHIEQMRHRPIVARKS